MNMFKKLSKSEQSLLQEMNKINIKKSYKDIVENAEDFFALYLSKCKTPIANIIVRMAIVHMIEETDTLAQPAKFSIKGRDNILKTFNSFSGFYEYALSIIDFIVENEDNAILDLYNDKKINEKELRVSLKISRAAQSRFGRNRKQLKKILSDISSAIERLKEGDAL